MDQLQDPDAVFEAELAECLVHRSSIDHAVGVLIQMLAVDEDRAFEVLRGYAGRHGARLHVVAARLVDAAAAGDTPPECDDLAEGVLQRLVARQLA